MGLNRTMPDSVKAKISASMKKAWARVPKAYDYLNEPDNNKQNKDSL